MYFEAAFIYNIFVESIISLRLLQVLLYFEYRLIKMYLDECLNKYYLQLVTKKAVTKS